MPLWHFLINKCYLPQENELEEDPETKIMSDSQEDYEPEFVLEEDVEEDEDLDLLIPAEGTPSEEEPEMILEEEEEEEEVNVKDLEEGVETVKLEDEIVEGVEDQETSSKQEEVIHQSFGVYFPPLLLWFLPFVLFCFTWHYVMLPCFVFC